MAEASRAPWERIPPRRRKRLVWSLWFVTWIGLLAGLRRPVAYEYVVFFSAAHAVVVLSLLRFRIAAFSAQVRVAYFLWVAAGTYLPGMTILLYITMIGLATNLFLGYCPLARLVYLLPWNRSEAFSAGLAARVFLTPPVVGPFRPAPPGR